MKKEKAIELLQLVATTLQTDYEYIKDCNIAIQHLLRQVDSAHLELTGKSIIRQRTLIEAIATPPAK